VLFATLLRLSVAFETTASDVADAGFGRLERIPDIGVDQDTQDPHDARTWDHNKDPLGERLIKLCEEKTKTPQENQLKAVIADGASPSYLGEYNYTGLMWCAVRHKPELAKVLLAAGADTESVNAWGRDAMFVAAWEQQDAIVEELILAGANVSASAQHDEWQAIHKAAEVGNAKMVQMLLDAGADPQARTLPDDAFPKGVTPLSITKSKEVKAVLKPAIAATKAARAAAKKAAEGAEATETENQDGAAPTEEHDAEEAAAFVEAEVEEEAGGAKDEL